MSRPDRASGHRRGRTQLLLIIALFLLPPVGAWVAWKMLGEQGVGATTNAGTLVSPARPLAVGGLRTADGSPANDGLLQGRWTYVVFAARECDERCRQQLYLTRQVRLAMSKDIPRVRRLLILDGPPEVALTQDLATEHADLEYAVLDEHADALLRQFSGDGFDPGGAKYFLVDPLGNLMMYYDLDVPAKGMMKDLQKLLKISQVG